MLVQSCSSKKEESAEKPVARVLDVNLYPSDLKNIVPVDMSKKDSSELIKRFIEKWIQDELVLKYAEKNLTSEQLNIEKEVTEYRKNLIIYSYQTELIKQKLDTVVTQQEIEKYYNEHSASFVLKDNIVNVNYVKLNKKTPGIEKARKWYVSSNPKDIENLRSFCIQFAENYFLDDKTWLLFDDILKEVPIEDYNSELFLKSSKNIEVADSLSVYFLKIKGYKIKNSPSPLSFEKENIRNIIINKRKLKLIDEMKSNVYQEAKENKNFVIY
ncbi:MAG: peptidyl-prolyl cis-trans isomerase [Bacteroidota bacterium]|nr:peptidyl-prolyl cis-trans isomerase [Bacteroidota bacterium]